ncbi:MAG: hypothetical protein ACK56F_20280, partial [bacterium]
VFLVITKMCKVYQVVCRIIQSRAFCLNSVHSAYLYMFIEWQTNNKNFKALSYFKALSAFKALLFLHERFPIPA